MRGAIFVVVSAFVTVSLFLMAGLAQEQAAGEVDAGAVFSSTCASCHGRSGSGIPGVFPPLADHLPDLVAAEGGRAYVMSVVLYGLQGELMIDGMPFNGVMPPQGHLSDEQIAAVLNHVLTELSEEDPEADVQLFAADEVAVEREETMTPSQVLASRPDLAAAETEAEISEEDMVPPTFTAAQAERGNSVYRSRCTECHGTNLQGGVVGGPPLRGGYFEQRWNGRSVAALFEYTRARMPQDRPGSLSDQAYADIVALILQTNGHNAGGAALPASADALQRFIIGR